MREVEIVLPRFHEKQLQVFDSTATEILFAGDTRAGKSFFIRKAYILFCSQIPGLQCDIFRLHHDDVIAENMQGETGFPVLLNAWEKAGLVKINQTEITFWNESKISLEHCSDDVVMLKHQGIAKHVRTFAESTQILEHRIRALTGWVTMSEEMKSRVPEKWKGLFPKVYHVTNPKGVSSGYYRREFVDMRPPYSIEKVGQFRRQYIPAFLDDNPSEDKQATIDRISQAFPDEETQKSLINSDKSGVTNWHSGNGEFFPEWNPDRHVVTDFYPPAHWFRFRTFDWGTAEPFCCLWFAVSDGEPFRDEQGIERWFPRGALIIYDEWYGCDQREPAKGIRMRNEDMARGIIQRTERDFPSLITLTDSKPFQDMGGEGIAMTFQKNGCPLTQADTSRVAGWSQMRGRLIGVEYDSNAIGKDGKPYRLPMLYVCARAKYVQAYVPSLPRHPSESKKEDAAEHGEATHACDSVRYACMAHPIVKDAVLPMQTRIDRMVKNSSKLSVNKIMRSMGSRPL